MGAFVRATKPRVGADYDAALKSGALEVRPRTVDDLTPFEPCCGRGGAPLDGVAEALPHVLPGRPSRGKRGGRRWDSRSLRTMLLLRSVAVDEQLALAAASGRARDGRWTWPGSAGIEDVYLLTTTAERYFPSSAFLREPGRGGRWACGRTVEFQDACPATATVMRKTL